MNSKKKKKKKLSCHFFHKFSSLRALLNVNLDFGRIILMKA